VTLRGGRLAGFSDFVAELRRRRVIRTLLAWGVFAFAVLQIYEPVMHGLHLPEWTLTAVVLSLAAGFPVAAVLAWIFDITTRGIERTGRSIEEPPGSSPSFRSRGIRLAIILLGIGSAAAAPGLFYFFGWPGAARRLAEVAGPGPAERAGPSVAVLSFTDMSPARDQEYFADGVAEEIRNALARVEGLRVPGRSSSFWFKGRSVKLAEIGRELQVGAVLEGSVRKDGTRVRVTAQLVNVGDGYPLWSETFDRELTDIFGIQDEIARVVVEALKVKLFPGLAVARAGPGPVKPEVYEKYLLGREYMRRGGTEPTVRQAAGAFERALALDPAYAPAWAGLARALARVADYATAPASRTDAQERSLAAADRAVELDPDLAAGWATRGYLRTFMSWDWVGAQADLERALVLSPADGEVIATWGSIQASLGRLTEGIASLRKAIDVDPLSPEYWSYLAYLLIGAGRFEDGAAAARRAIAIDPEYSPGPRNLGIALLLGGRQAEAAAAFEKCLTRGSRLLGVALVEHARGNAGESQAALKEMMSRYASGWAYQVAWVHAWRGEKDRAFDWLDQAYQQHDSGIAHYVKFDPLLRNVRDDPRYGVLLRKVHLADLPDPR
jgi:TolB-like protein/tetratricopeptide (TPR) repeat protein